MKKENLKAIRKSIKHWALDIRRPFLNGDKILLPDEVEGHLVFVWWSSCEPVNCTGTSCDLCSLNDRSGCYYICFRCPLQRNGMGCSRTDSPYSAFCKSPNLETATGMVHALVGTYWAERNEK